MLQGQRILILCCILVGLALALQAGLVAFAGYVVIGVMVVSQYLAKSWITNLEIDRKCSSEAREVGESVEVIVRVRNRGTLPIGWLLIEDMLPEYALRQRPARLSVKGRRIQILFLRPRTTRTIKYTVTFLARGYYQLGPTFAETGDVFGLHRRHRILSEPAFVLVLPKILPLPQYQFASQRPIGEVRLANRLFEDPTRTAGVRPYVVGDPLQRVHWRATARTGQLHCRVYEPTSLAGATLLIDFHAGGFPKRSEPVRSELCITAACALAYAVSVLNQQIGLASNGRDASERIKEEAVATLPKPESEEEDTTFSTRYEVRDRFESTGNAERLRPLVVETRRGFDQFQQIREALGRLETTDAMTFSKMVFEMAPRLPRDATVIAILPQVPVETAVALGQLRREGFAVSAILVGMKDDEDDKPIAYGRLLSEGIRDVRAILTEADLQNLGVSAPTGPSTYNVAVTLA